jgi:hypothetical protein
MQLPAVNWELMLNMRSKVVSIRGVSGLECNAYFIGNGAHQSASGGIYY